MKIKFTLSSWLMLLLALSIIANIHLIFRALDYRRGANEWLSKYTHMVAEFSGRDVYSREDKALASDTIVTNRIVFIGTQIIDTWNTDNDFKDYEIIKRAVPGQYAAGMLLRFKQDVIDLKPEAVLIEISSYNLRPQHTVQEIEDYVSSMADLARMHDIIPILSTMIPLRKGHEKFEDYSIIDNLKEYDRWLLEYCDKNSLKYADFNRVLADENGNLKTELSADPVTPNAEGYRLMSESLLTVLNSL
jgi:hypothetical protein